MSVVRRSVKILFSQFEKLDYKNEITSVKFVKKNMN